MKSPALMCVTTTLLFALLAIPTALAAQEQIEKKQPLHDNLTTYLDRADDQPEAMNNEQGPEEASAFVLRDLGLPASNAAITEPDEACVNCLIRLCLVGSNKRLTGYCLEGARGGICHEDYSPTHCPPGATPKKVVLSQSCGFSGKFLVDALRPCS